MNRPAYKRGVRIAATIAPKASRMIDDLLATGLHGFTRAAFVQEAVYRRLRDAMPELREIRSPKRKGRP